MIVPFFIPHFGCPHQCVFCNQKRITGVDIPPDTAALSAKMRLFLEGPRLKQDVQIAFYGGSFTALPLDVQKKYLSSAHSFVKSGQARSIRISTRPDRIDREILSLLKEHGVDTVELGAQSMNDKVLFLSGRGHASADTVSSVTLLREHGFTVGLQLMPGLPGDSAEIFSRTVDRTIELKPDFVRLYPALVIRDTPLELLYKTGRYVPLSLDDAVAWCGAAKSRFEPAGISVIRMGLQPTEELEKAGTIIAGPYHPAFRQLVESSILLDEMRRLLSSLRGTEGTVVISANPRDISNAIGQRRTNIAALKKEFGLGGVRILPDENVHRGKVSLHECSAL